MNRAQPRTVSFMLGSFPEGTRVPWILLSISTYSLTHQSIFSGSLARILEKELALSSSNTEP